MSILRKIVPTSPDSPSSSETGNKVILDSFQLKPVGAKATRITLVDNDSLSSYSWPDETSHANTGENAAIGATQDASVHVDPRNGQSTSSDSKSQPNNRVFICINSSQETGPHQELTYIQAYMKFMYWTCVSPFNPMKNEEGAAATNMVDRMLNYLQKIFFAVIMSLSIIQSFLEAKFTLLFNFSEGNLETFINMSYFIMLVASKIYYVYLLLRQQWKFVRMFKSLRKLDEFKMRNLAENKTPNTSMKYTIVLGTVSIVVCLMHIIWSVGLRDWTPEKTLDRHFQQMAEHMFVWTLNEFENGTVAETFVKENGQGLTGTKAFLGGLRMIMIFCSYLHNDALTNMMLTNAETIRKETRILEEKISNTETKIENVTLAEFLTENGNWAYYKLLKLAINDNNDAFDSLLKYKHASNLMLFVYFVLNVFDEEFSLTYIIRLMYNITRTSYTYRIATQASSPNDAERKWIRRLTWNSNDRAFLDKVPIILDELDKEQIGMGKGQFLIDESFLYRFIGSVGSVFVLQAQSRETKAE